MATLVSHRTVLAQPRVTAIRHSGIAEAQAHLHAEFLVMPRFNALELLEDSDKQEVDLCQGELLTDTYSRPAAKRNVLPPRALT